MPDDLQPYRSTSGPASDPFQEDTFVTGRTPLPGVERIHDSLLRRVLARVKQLDGDRTDRESGGAEASSALPGRIILLSAPRAGYGKTHFAERLRLLSQSFADCLDLRFHPGRRISWPAVLGTLLRQFSGPSPQTSTVDSLLGKTARHFLSETVQAALAESPALAEGEGNPIPEAFRSQESSSGSAAPREDCFLAGREPSLLEWALPRCGDLAGAAAARIGARFRLGEGGMRFWTRLLLDVCRESPGTTHALLGLSPGEARQRTLQLLGIAAARRPLLLRIDHLDGFHHSENVAMELADLLTSVRAEVPRCLSLLCLNDDVWESAFQGQLPSAWLDRLTGDLSTLPSLSAEEAEELVRERLLQHGVDSARAKDFAGRLRREEEWDAPERVPLHPRGVIRAARSLWESTEGEGLSLESGPGIGEISGLPAGPVSEENAEKGAPEKIALESADTAPVTPAPPVSGKTSPAKTFPSPAMASPSPSTGLGSPYALETDPGAAEFVRGSVPEKSAVSPDPLSPSGDLSDILELIEDIRKNGNTILSEVEAEEERTSRDQDSGPRASSFEDASPATAPEPVAAKPAPSSPPTPATDLPEDFETLEAGPLTVRNLATQSPEAPSEEAPGSPADEEKERDPEAGAGPEPPASVPGSPAPEPPRTHREGESPDSPKASKSPQAPIPPKTESTKVPLPPEEPALPAKRTAPAPAPVPLSAPPAGSEMPAPFQREQALETLRQREQALLAEPPPSSWNHGDLERFLRDIAAEHPGLHQGERNVIAQGGRCLEWIVGGRKVLVAFEGPGDVYFWSTLLRESLAEERSGVEKVTAFSLPDSPFDADDLGGFGFGADAVRKLVDIVPLNSEEIALLQAADFFLEETGAQGHRREALQLLVDRFATLWQRLCWPLDVS